MARGNDLELDYLSWSEYREALSKLDPSKQVGDRAWCGTESIGEALAIADKGWPEGMERVRDISLPVMDSIASSTEAVRGRWRWDVQGADYDVGTYLAGVPECWLDRSAIKTKPLITISANIVSSWAIPKEALEMRGAAVVALTQALQTAGYAVRVYAIEGMLPRPGKRNVWHRVCLTDDKGGPLDMDRLLFALAHPSAARQLGYALGCNAAGVSTGDIGWPSDNQNTMPPDEWASDIYLHAPYISDTRWNDKESVTKWVTETYAQLTEGGE
jgi:hypothetical protein